MGDTLGLVMLENGDDPAKVTDASFERAIKRVQKAVDSGQIRKFYGNDYAPVLAKGDLRRRWRGPAISPTSPTRTCTGALPTTAGSSGPTT